MEGTTRPCNCGLCRHGSSCSDGEALCPALGANQSATAATAHVLHCTGRYPSASVLQPSQQMEMWYTLQTSGAMCMLYASLHYLSLFLCLWQALSHQAGSTRVTVANQASLYLFSRPCQTSAVSLITKSRRSVAGSQLLSCSLTPIALWAVLPAAYHEHDLALISQAMLLSDLHMQVAMEILCCCWATSAASSPPSASLQMASSSSALTGMAKCESATCLQTPCRYIPHALTVPSLCLP